MARRTRQKQARFKKRLSKKREQYRVKKEKYKPQGPLKRPSCPYCRSSARLVDSREIYKGRSFGFSWVCAKWPKCDSYVGCHPGSDRPMGRMANRELRKAKKAAHMAFDPIWQTGRMLRATAYMKLAKRLGIAVEDCHIGMFSLEECQRVVEVCKTWEE